MSTKMSFHNPRQGKFDTMTHVHSVNIKEPDRSIDWSPVLAVIAVVGLALVVALYFGII